MMMFLVMTLFSCSADTTKETFLWKTSENYNLYVTIVHRDEILIREEITEEHFLNDDEEVNDLKSVYTANEVMYGNEILDFDYVIKDKYLKVTMSIDLENMTKDNMNDYIYGYIGESSFDDNDHLTYQSLKSNLIELGFKPYENN